MQPVHQCQLIIQGIINKLNYIQSRFGSMLAFGQVFAWKGNIEKEKKKKKTLMLHKLFYVTAFSGLWGFYWGFFLLL